MKDLQKRISEADNLLASYAVKHTDGLGREYDESVDATRFRFQRDRGRIIHTTEFRRLKGKTQVFVGGGGDHYRTRLTHTMEVAGISRDIARALGLNEDLAECIALAHDLGHPPFGHAGEAALNRWMMTRGTSFEHNVQSHRIVTVLSEHSAHYKGLNLNREILEGLLKHETPFDLGDASHSSHRPTLEAQVVNLADEIAYTAHDCEDGIRSEVISEHDLIQITLAQDAAEQARGRVTSLRGAVIDILVRDLYSASEKRLEEEGIQTLQNVYDASEPLICFSGAMREQLDALRHFLWEEMYNHPQVLSRAEAGQSVVAALCDHYITNPNEKIDALVHLTGDTTPVAVKDYVAGMTDAYAFLQAEEAGILGDDVEGVLEFN